MESWQGKTVVIVDDSDMIRSCLRHLFEEVGMTVIGEASDGREALQVISELSPDLVSLDINIPIFSGPEVYAELIKEQNAPSFLIISCLADLNELGYASSPSFTKEPFISKLPTIPALRQNLGEIFSSSHKKKEDISESIKTAV